jgi:hypothetical protein
LEVCRPDSERIWPCSYRKMKYGGNKSIKENSLRPWVLIPEDNRHSTVTRKIPLFSVEPVTISYTHYWVHWFLPVKYFICKNYLDWDIFRYFYFFTKYIALLSLIVNKNEVFIYNKKNVLSFVWFCMTFWIYIHVRKWNEKWILRLCNFLIKKNVRKISTFLYYRTSETN